MALKCAKDILRYPTRDQLSIKFQLDIAKLSF